MFGGDGPKEEDGDVDRLSHRVRQVLQSSDADAATDTSRSGERATGIARELFQHVRWRYLPSVRSQDVCVRRAAALGQRPSPCPASCTARLVPAAVRLIGGGRRREGRGSSDFALGRLAAEEIGGSHQK